MSNIYSHHHFMFPFRWDILPARFKETDIKEDISFDNRTDLASVPDLFGNWKRFSFSFRDETDTFKPKSFNEFTYFHEYVSKAIYDFPYPWKRGTGVMKYYEYEIKKNSGFKINLRENGVLTQMLLEVDGITLHLYNTGVGVLTFNLTNRLDDQATPEAILKINEFGRRIYPQFLGNDGCNACKGILLADSIELDIGEVPIIEDFEWYSANNIYVTPNTPLRLPAHISSLFPDDFVFELTGNLEKRKILITKITDDRMFFLSWYGNNGLSKKLADDFHANRTIINDWWYAHIFGDKEPRTSVANSEMQKNQLSEHSYSRWIESQTLYGMSRDSFVCLTDTGGFAFDHLRIHMQTIYYNLMVLCLAQRASILKFTAEVANLSDLAKSQDDKNLMLNIKEINKNYIEFINKMYFREVTPQIQGIELYNQIQSLMNIRKEINDLDKEIIELHQYVSLIQDSERNDEAARLNRLAIFFLPFTVVFGIMGANVFGEDSFISSWNQGPMWLAIIVGVLISLFISAVIFALYTYKKK